MANELACYHELLCVCGYCGKRVVQTRVSAGDGKVKAAVDFWVVLLQTGVGRVARTRGVRGRECCKASGYFAEVHLVPWSQKRRPPLAAPRPARSADVTFTHSRGGQARLRDENVEVGEGLVECRIEIPVFSLQSASIRARSRFIHVRGICACCDNRPFVRCKIP